MLRFKQQLEEQPTTEHERGQRKRAIQVQRCIKTLPADRVANGRRHCVQRRGKPLHASAGVEDQAVAVNEIAAVAKRDQEIFPDVMGEADVSERDQHREYEIQTTPLSIYALIYALVNE